MSSTLILAKRELIDRVQSTHVLALLVAYVVVSVGYGWFSYISFVAALHPPQIPGNPTIIGAVVPPPSMSLLINVGNVYSFGALLAFAVSFDCICSEKVSKSLALLSALPISRGSILKGKLLGISSLVIPIGTTLPVAAIAFSLSLQRELNLNMLPRIASLALIAALYLLLWLCFAVFISSITSNPASSLALCFATWILFQSRFIGTMLPVLITATYFPGQALVVLAASNNTAFFSLNRIVASLIPPFSLLHATYGYYQFTDFFTTSMSNFSYSNYILNSARPYLSWLQFAWADLAILLASIIVLTAATLFFFNRSDIV